MDWQELTDLTHGRPFVVERVRLADSGVVVEGEFEPPQLAQLSLDDQVTLQGSDFMGGTGVLYGKAHSGDKYSYRDLVSMLFRYSDNTAWQALRRSLSASAIDSYAASIGAPSCHQLSDNCTAREAGVDQG